MPDFEASVLGALVTASIFSTTFASARIHDLLNRAVDRSDQLRGQLDLNRPNGWHQPLTEEERVLVTAKSDRFSVLMLLLTLVFAALLWWRIRAYDMLHSPALIAFALTEGAIVIAGILDHVLVRRDLANRLSEHPTHLATSARESLLATFNRGSYASLAPFSNWVLRKSLDQARTANFLSKESIPTRWPLSEWSK